MSLNRVSYSLTYAFNFIKKYTYVLYIRIVQNDNIRILYYLSIPSYLHNNKNQGCMFMQKYNSLYVCTFVDNEITTLFS